MFHSLSFSRADVWFLLVCLLTVSFPWNERINSVFILLLGVHWLCDRNLAAKVASLRQNWKMVLPFWLFIFLHVLFLPRTMYPNEALQTIEVKLSFLLLPLLFSTENYLNSKMQQRLFMLFSVSCLLSAVYCVVMYLILYYPTLQWTMVFNRMYFSDAIMHPGYYSNFFVIAVIFLALDLTDIHELSLQRKTVSILLIIAFLGVLFILVSKTAVILLIIFSIFSLWKSLQQLKHKYVKYVLFAALTGITIMMFTAVPSIRNRIADTKANLSETDTHIQFGNSTGSRIAAWGLEWELIKERWLTGYGTGNANQLLQNKFITEKYENLAFHKMHTHNQILHTWIDLGIAGVLSLLAVFISCFIYFYKSENQLGIWTTALLFLYCLTDDALEIQAITVFCVFVICLLLFRHNKTEEVR